MKTAITAVLFGITAHQTFAAETLHCSISAREHLQEAVVFDQSFTLQTEDKPYVAQELQLRIEKLSMRAKDFAPDAVDYPVTVLNATNLNGEIEAQLIFETGAADITFPIHLQRGNQSLEVYVNCQNGTGRIEDVSKEVADAMKQVQCTYRNDNVENVVAKAPVLPQIAVRSILVPGGYISTGFVPDDKTVMMEVSDPLYNYSAVMMTLRPFSRFTRYSVNLFASAEHGYPTATLSAECRQLSTVKPVQIVENPGFPSILIDGIFENEFSLSHTQSRDPDLQAMQLHVTVNYENATDSAAPLQIHLPSGKTSEQTQVYTSIDRKTHVYLFMVDLKGEVADASGNFKPVLGGSLKRGRVFAHDVVFFRGGV